MKRKNLNIAKLQLNKKGILSLSGIQQDSIQGMGAGSVATGKICVSNVIACTRLTEHICITVGGGPCPTGIDNCY